MQPNELYNTHLRLIFYDEPIFGHYQERFDRIFAEPRYTDLAANLSYFSQLYTAILARSQMLPSGMSAARTAFDRRYYDAIAQQKADVDAKLAKLSRRRRLTLECHAAPADQSSSIVIQCRRWRGRDPGGAAVRHQRSASMCNSRR